MPKKKLGMWVLSAVVIVVLVASALYKRYALPPYGGANATLVATENALAAPETLILASLDIDYLKKLDTKLHGKPSLPDLNSGTSDDESVMDVLRRAAMVNPEAISYVTAAVFVGKDGALSTALVAGGELRPEAVVKVLQGSAQVQPHPQLQNAWVVQVQDANTCKSSKEWTVVVTPQRIVAVNSLDTTLLERIQNAAPAARDLTRWREFRKSRFASAALFIPGELPPQSLAPIVGGMARAAKQGLIDFDTIYLGANANAFPPSGNLALWMSARTPAIAADKAAAWQAAIAASRKEWERMIPTVAALHDQAKIHVHDNLLQADITLDKAMTDQLRKLPSELIGLLFAGFNMRAPVPQSAVNAPPPAEELDKNPRKFVDQLNAAQIQPFDPKVTFAEPADVSVGPFGIQFVGARLTESDPRLLELEVKAMGTNLPNIGDDPASAMALAVTSVRDKDGKELLKPEPCGKDRNSLAAHPAQDFGNGFTTATKTVRLQESSRHADVATIHGVATLRIPTRIETVSLSAPKAGDHVERERLRIEVTQVEGASISYRISGDGERLLLFRAKNAKGQPLAQGSSMSMSMGFGDGKSVTREFKGQPASIEFILAQATEKKDFAFELKGARPQAKDNWTVDKPPTYEAYSKPELKHDLQQLFAPKRHQSPLASGKAGAAVIDLDRAYAVGDLRLNLSLYLPPLKNLDGALSGAEFDLQTLMLADGSVHHPGKTAWRAVVPVNRAGGNYFSGRADVETDIKSKSDAVRSVTGRLSLRVPLAVEKSALAVADVGTQTATPCGPVQLTEISRDGVTLEGAGDPGCLFAVRALNADGKDLRVNNVSIKRRSSGWREKFSIQGVPASLELVTAKKMELVDLPFMLNTGEIKPKASR